MSQTEVNYEKQNIKMEILDSASEIRKQNRFVPTANEQEMDGGLLGLKNLQPQFNYVWRVWGVFKLMVWC